MKKLTKVILMVAIFMIALPFYLQAAQFDAPYYDLQEKNKDKWAAEDKQINAKLAALEKKFGKKPNIIYILADDVGWGEMGWQGGGKHRGTPTPQLDKMALEECVSGAPTRNRLAHRLELPLTRAAIQCAPGCCLYSGQGRPTGFPERR